MRKTSLSKIESDTGEWPSVKEWRGEEQPAKCSNGRDCRASAASFGESHTRSITAEYYRVMEKRGVELVHTGGPHDAVSTYYTLHL